MCRQVTESTWPAVFHSFHPTSLLSVCISCWRVSGLPLFDTSQFKERKNFAKFGSTSFEFRQNKVVFCRCMLIV